MKDSTPVSPALKKKHGWLRAIVWIFGVLVVLLVVLFFVATSSSFFKGTILPRVGKAMNAQITVSDASISPFKQVILRDLKVQTTGTEPLVTAAEVRLRYSLMDIIRGKIHVDEVTVSALTVALVENPDGSSNLDPILKSQETKTAEKKPATPAASSAAKPLQIDLKKFALTDVTLRRVKNFANGTREVAELSHVHLTLDNLKNGQTAKLVLGTDMSVQQTNATLQAKLAGTFSLGLAEDLKPSSIKGSARLEVTQAAGALADAAAFGSEINMDVTPTEINEIVLRFQRGNADLGELRVSGPLNMQKLEGRLSIVLAGIDKQLLNLAGASSGMDFGSTLITSTNEVELTKGGAMITAKGQLDVTGFQLTRMNQATPQLNLRSEYDVTVDSSQSMATMRTLTMTGTQKGEPLLKAELTSPMQISWGDVSDANGDSAFTLAVTGFNLADWKPFVGEVAPAGIVKMTAKVLSQQGGKQLTLGFDSQIDHLAVNAASNHIADLSVTLHANAGVTDLKQFNLVDCKLEVAHQSKPLTTVNASGTYDTENGAADMQVAVQATLAALLQTFPQPGMTVSSGTIAMKAHVTQKEKAQALTGNLVLADFSGQFGANELRGFGTTMDFDVGMASQKVQVRKLAGKLTQGANAGGNFDLTATVDLATKSTDLTAKLVDINQNAIAPLLEPMLAGKTLVSVAINANTTAHYDPQGASSIKADLQVKNLVVKDPKGQFPETPLEVGMGVDASLQKQVAELRQFQITLTPTARSTNKLLLTGQVDMSKPSAIQGSLKLAADSLDFTSYYDLFMGGKQAAAPATASTPAPAPVDPNKEPDPIMLPFSNFTAETSIGQLFLHDIEIVDWQTTTKIEGGHVVVNPFKLTLNGAPVNSTIDLDLGLPGWKYDLSFNALAVPLAPLVDSFQPESKGQMGGTVTAEGHISGAGITGTSLQKNLNGVFDVNSTNLNLNAENIKNPILSTLVKAVSDIPGLLQNPKDKIGSLLGTLTGRPAPTGGGTNDLQQTPINAIIVQGTAGSGRIELQKAVVQSSSFQADVDGGAVTLASVITNSLLQIPVSISLSQPVAQRIGLVTANTPTNAPFVKVPDFLTLTGTVGAPKPQINYAALAGTVTDAIKVLRGRGKQVQTDTQGNQSDAAANAQPPAEAAPKLENLIDGLFGPKKKKK